MKEITCERKEKEPDNDSKVNPKVIEGVHTYGKEEDWVEPDEPLLRKRLEWFKDLKLGLFIHWGLYSQIGSVESWLLSDEDSAWSHKDLTWDDPNECQKQYKRLNRSFNPIRFRPDEWADNAIDCGFKYVILTTKHHDGFCLWDTTETKYKITNPDCPFSEHKYADICKHAFQAFRAKGLAITAYFSKADWSHPCYWNPEMQDGLPSSRGVNYNPLLHPERWEKFVDFTHSQIMEIIQGCGLVDVLWLDAGWVNARQGEDIKLDELAKKVRAVHPGMLIADRTVGGQWENILTPESTIPEKPMNVPWESCIPLDRNRWGYSFEPDYHSAREIIHSLVEIVAKGGNLALGIGPQPDGRLPAKAVEILHELGTWLKINGEAIYATRICEPYSQGKWLFTRKNGNCYAIRRIDDDETADSIDWTIPFKKAVRRIKQLNGNGDIPFWLIKSGVKLEMDTINFTNKTAYAIAFKIYL